MQLDLTKPFQTLITTLISGFFAVIYFGIEDLKEMSNTQRNSLELLSFRVDLVEQQIKSNHAKE